MTTTALQNLIGKGQQHLRGITSPDKYPSFTAFAKTSYENGYTWCCDHWAVSILIFLELECAFAAAVEKEHYLACST